jgi:hypothetical protein
MLKLQKRLKGIFLCLSALFCLNLAAQQQPLVAVMTPVASANSVTPGIQGFVRGKLEELVLSTKKYRVVDRTRIDQVSAEHTFTRNGMVDNNLVKDIGKLMQADIVCVSKIEKEPGLIVVNCSLVDVESGEVFGSSSEMTESDGAAAIRDCAEKAGRKMLGLPPPIGANEPEKLPPQPTIVAPPKPEPQPPVQPQPQTRPEVPNSRVLTGTVRGYPRITYEVRVVGERVRVRFDYTAAGAIDKDVYVHWGLDDAINVTQELRGYINRIGKGNIQDYWLAISDPDKPEVKLGAFVTKRASNDYLYW